ncbi:MAG: hypothetical protein Q7J85_09430 [Bacillota bacterium]|nr:hypothetical protein [Bacillota bacterium]
MIRSIIKENREADPVCTIVYNHGIGHINRDELQFHSVARYGKTSEKSLIRGEITGIVVSPFAASCKTGLRQTVDG